MLEISKFFEDVANIDEAYAKIDEAREISNIIIRPSGISGFCANRFGWALKQLLSISFGNSAETVLGTALHACADNFYKGKTLDEIKEEMMAVVDAEYKYVNTEKAKITADEIKNLAWLYFHDYYLSYAEKIKGNIVGSELQMEVPFNELVTCKGTTDHVIKDEAGNYVICDIKTSGKSLGGLKIEDFDPEGAVLLQEQKDLTKKMGLKKTTEEEKTTFQARLDELAPLCEAVMAKYDKAVAEKRKKEALAAYGLQLATYAMLYEATTGTSINKARIELMVKTKTPSFMVIDIEISAYKAVVEYELDTMLEVIKAWKGGTPARILFGYNPTGYYDSELKDYLGY